MLDTCRLARLLVSAPLETREVGVELSVMEQRYQAVLAAVQDGWKVTEAPLASASRARASTPGPPASGCPPGGRVG
jgi:hypothetical protein